VISKLKLIMSALLVLTSLALSQLVAAAIPQSERDVLMSLYEATNGGSWNINNNWCSGTCPIDGVPTFNDPGTECSWAHVTCDADEAHVTLLVLGDNNLNGQLPSLQGLTQLAAFEASWNNLSGPIPDFSGMNALNFVELSTDQLTGPFPDLTRLTGLYSIDVSFNQLSGPIPNFSGLALLETVNANNNLLSGTLAPLAGLPQFQQLYLSNNRLTGTIPTFAGLNWLNSIALDNNLFTGPIPDLSQLNVGTFYADHNQLTGAVPPASSLMQSNRFNARLCPNPLSLEPSANDLGWDKATGSTPWWGPAGQGCDHIFSDIFGG
jgi:hypothetical protein